MSRLVLCPQLHIFSGTGAMPFGSASAPSSNNPTPVFGASAAQPAANPFGANSAAAKPAFNFGGAAASAAFSAGGQ